MSWTRQRLFATAVVIFLGQLGAIFALHTREPLLVKLPPFPAVHAGSPSRHSNSPELQYLNDPMIFAGAHTAGFSAAAWLGRARLDFNLSNSVPPPTFLDFERHSTIEIASSNPPPQITPLPLLNFSLSNDTPRQSRLVLEGPLSSRPLAANPPIPIQFGTDVLSNSVVQVSVQADGFTVLSRLVSGSGSRAADLTALEIANKLRFAPQPLQSVAPSSEGAPEPLQWGRLVFQWFTTEPASTNVPAPAKK